MKIKKFYNFIVVVILCLTINISTSKAGIVKGMLWGAGAYIGYQVVKAVNNWYFDDNSGTSIASSYSYPNQNQHSNSPAIQGRINTINKNLASINKGLATIQWDIKNLSNQVNSLKAIALNNSEKIQVITLILEKNEIEKSRKKIVDKITERGEIALNASNKSLNKFIDSELQNIKKTASNDEKQFKLDVLNKFMLFSLSIVNQTTKEKEQNHTQVERDFVYSGAQYLKSKLSSLPVAEKSTSNNQFVDALESSMIAFKEKELNNLRQEWKIHLNKNISKNDFNTEDNIDDVLEILDEKSNQKSRDNFKVLKNNLYNPKSMDQSLNSYKQLKNEISTLNLKSDEFKLINNAIDSYIQASSANNIFNEGGIIDSLERDIKQDQAIFDSRLFKRDIKDPCITYLMDKIPGLSQKFLEKQVELTYLKLAWAYLDSQNIEQPRLNGKIQIINKIQARQVNEKELLEKYLDKDPSISKDLLTKLILIQNTKKENMNNAYFMNTLDEYALKLVNKINPSLSAVGLLKMVEESYTNSSYQGFYIDEIENLIAKNNLTLSQYNKHVEGFLKGPECHNYTSSHEGCGSLSENFNALAFINTIISFDDKMTKVLQKIEVKFPEISLNNKTLVDKQLKKQRVIEKKLRKQEKARSEQLALNQRNAEEKKKRDKQNKIINKECSQLVGVIVSTHNTPYVYKVDEPNQFYMFMQPDDEIKVNFLQGIDKKGRFLATDTKGKVLGMIHRDNLNFGQNNSKCFKMF